MVKHTQKISRQQPMNCLNDFKHFVGLGLKGLTTTKRDYFSNINQKLVSDNKNV